MAKTSIYLPDDLAEQARGYGIPVSEVAQAAVRQAVRAAQLKESVMTDISAVAERLHATRVAAAEAVEAEAARVRQEGARWAREQASAADLGYVVSYRERAVDDYRTPGSLFDYALGRGFKGFPMRPSDANWNEFQAGAREVWEAVQPLLAEIDETPR